MTEAVLASGGQYLQDGFQEIFSFNGHKLQVRGLDTVDIGDHNSNTSGARLHDQFLSWDVKAILLWEDNGDGTPKVLSRYNFPKNQPQYICAVVYIPKMKVFLAAALDMTFKIFDKHFRLLQEFHHDERAILSLQYDSERGIVICSGASGITVWRCYRNLSLDNNHVVEKLFTFEGCDQWVSSMIYESQSKKLYGLVDRSVHVFSFSKRAVVTVLKDVHEAPVTTVCWYGRSQFYLTGCSQGLIKCWTSHFRDVNKLQNMGAGDKDHDVGGGDDDDEVHSVKYALLHTFHCHTKAITGLILHSTSGLAISTSMDGFVRVLNLEAFNELFSVDTGRGITGMRGINYGVHMACLFSQSNGRIRLWKVTSCCNFFGISAASIETLDCFDNLQLEDVRHDQFLSAKSENGGKPAMKHSASDGTLDESVHSDTIGANEDETGIEDHTEELEGDSEILHQSDYSHESEHDEEMETEAPAHTSVDNSRQRLVASYAAQDLRVYNSVGGLVCRVEPTEVVDGIHSYTISVYQELLFCLLHSGKVKIYCCRSANSPLVKETVISKKSYEQIGTGLCLIDVVPSAASSGLATNNVHSKERSHQTLRLEPVPTNVNELLLVSNNSGMMTVMDTLNGMDICCMFQASTGPVSQIKYRKARKELFALCHDNLANGICIRIWKLPSLEILTSTLTIADLSCYDISPTLSYLGVGCTDGFVRLFKLDPAIESMCTEVEKLCLVHDGAIVSISFCDPLQLYATSSMDSTVKIWDFQKRFIRSIKFNIPPTAIKFHGKVGDIIVSQKNYLLQSTIAIWNEGNYLQKVQETDDPWNVDIGSQLTEDERNAEFDRFQRLIAIANKNSKADGFVSKHVHEQSIASLSRESHHKSVEFAPTLSYISSELAPAGQQTSVLDVHTPRFYYEMKPPVQYKIPEIDSVLSSELTKESFMLEKLKIERGRKSQMHTTHLSEAEAQSIEADVNMNRSLYIARNVAKLGLSPRARLVLLQKSEPETAETASHPETDSRLPNTSMLVLPTAPAMPVPSANLSQRPLGAARTSILHYSSGRATLMATKPVFSSTSDGPVIETIESTSIVPIPGDVLLSSQFRTDRQSFIARKARLRHPEVVPTEDASATHSLRFKRDRDHAGPSSEAMSKAVEMMKIKAEETKRKAIEEEEQMRVQRDEKQKASEVQQEALAKLHIPLDHIGQLLNRTTVTKGRRKSGVGRTSHITSGEDPSAGGSDQGTTRGIAMMSSAIFDRSMRFTQSTGINVAVESLSQKLDNEYESLPVLKATREDSMLKPVKEGSSSLPFRKESVLNSSTLPSQIAHSAESIPNPSGKQEVAQPDKKPDDWVNESFARASMILSTLKTSGESPVAQSKQAKRRTEFQSDPKQRSTFRVHGGAMN